MQVDISRFLHGTEAACTYSYKLDEHALPNKYFYPIIYPVSFLIKLYKVDEEYLFSSEGSYGYEADCDRCLKLTKKVIEFNASGKVMEYKGNTDEGEDSEEVINLEDEQLDLEEYIWNQIVSSLPMKFVCSDDCKGLCLHCGKDLNNESCRCNNNSGDLRFEKLRELSLND